MSGSSKRQGVAVAAASVVLGLTVAAAGALAASTNFSEFGSSPEDTGLTPTAIVTGDWDGDGDLDLATANISSGDVSVHVNNGRGNFRERATSPEDAGSFPSNLATADVDGDADLDLLVSNQESDDINVLRNNGAGNFAEPGFSPEPAGDVPVAMAPADFDLDGDRDVAVANAIESTTTNNVTILLNNGAGNLSAAASSPESAGNKPVAVVAADFDGDTDRDLAVANQQAGSVSILANNGSADFSPLPSSPEFAGTFPQALAVGDLDGDGDRDLAVANQGTDNVTILRNDGFGDFSEPLSSPESVGNRPLSLLAADFDLDGDRDLAVPNIDDDNISILRNTQNANFAEPASSPEAAGADPRDAIAGDFDGDGDPDLAIANQTSHKITVLRNR